MKEKAKQLLTESSKIDGATVLIHEWDCQRSDYPLPLGEGQGEGLSSRKPSPPTPLPAGEGQHSLHPLANLLGPECADPVQAKREDDSIFISQTHVEGEILRGDHAALPGIADGRS